MKFRKFGKALLMTALSAGMVVGISVLRAKLYGRLSLRHRNANGLQLRAGALSAASKSTTIPAILFRSRDFPSASGGANPVRAVLLTGGRFVYVLNQGLDQPDGWDRAARPMSARMRISPSSPSAETVFWQPRGTTLPREINPIRMVADSSGALHLCARS